MFKKYFLLFPALFLLTTGIPAKAEELSPSFTLSTGGEGAYLKDGEHGTSYSFEEGATVTVRSADGSAMAGIYIIWDSPVNQWNLRTDSGVITCGQNGFLHEFISLEAPTASAVITVPSGGARISDIRIFSQDGPLPEDVQRWNAPCEKADIMLVPAHADDEILFLGGIIPTYGVVGEMDIQVVYMAEFWSSAKIREHEKLDGLWEAGLKNYPVCGNFKDLYSKTIEEAQSQYSFDAMTEFVTAQIRRFQPQVIVTHDQKGEYGHGFHMLTSLAVTTAVEYAGDENRYPDSASAYGTWDTPKTYLHLYEENKIRLDLRQPIDAMGGRTALEVAADAYKKHVSQQWCWFYVSDDYQYSCADFGLYRTTVGADTTGDDLFENLKTYKLQQQEKEEAQRQAEAQAALERQRREEEARRLEAERESAKQREQEQAAQEALRQQLEELGRQQKELSAHRSLVLGILLSVIVILASLLTFGILRLLKRRK
jgi:LmbE family N-acetylglucosaminyl deacetylase